MRMTAAAIFTVALMTGVSNTAMAQNGPAPVPPATAAEARYVMADGTRTDDYNAALESWRNDPQFAADYSKRYLGLEHAYARGLTGAGLTIGINDSGVYADHPLFSRDGKFLGLRTVVSADYGNDGLMNARRMWSDHGTHVAGTAAGDRVAGERMFGNAFGANIYSATINFAAGDFLWFRDAVIDGETVITTTQNIIDMANTGQVRIINNSWGSANSIAFNASRATVMNQLGNGFGNRYQSVLDNDVLVVFSAGNGGGVHAGVDAAAPLWTDTLRSNWLSVANYQGNLTPSPSTSFCGQTATWCVAGPGHLIVSSVLGFTFDTAAIQAMYPRARYPTIYGAGTVAALENAVGNQFVVVLNNYLTARRAAEAAGLPFDDNAARDVIAREAVALTLAAASRLVGANPDGFTTRLGSLLTSAGNMAVLGADFSRDILERSNAELERVVALHLRYTGPGYGTKTGTSMAAPNVSGFAALLMENFPEYNTALISDILVSSSLDLDTPGVDLRSGWGAPQMETALNGPTALRAVRDVTVAGGTVDIWSNDIGDARDRYSPEVLAGYPDDIGGIVKLGGGELNLTGTNDYSGVTRAQEGLLTVNGALTRSDAIVGGVGILGGTGRLFNLTAETGGVVSPGTPDVPFGVLTVVGDARFETGSFLWIRSSVNSAANSRLEVEGQTTLGGGQVVLRADDGVWNIRSSMDILRSAGGVDGTFDGVLTNLGFLTPTLSYSDDLVSLTLLRNDVPFASVGSTPNRRAVGRGLDGIQTSGPLYDALVDGSVAAVRQSLDSLTGEVHASLAGVAVNDTAFVRDAMLRRMPHSTMALNGASAGGAAENQTSSGVVAWGQAIAGFATHDGNANEAKVKSETVGFMTGIDKTTEENFNLGIAFGYLDSGVNVFRPGSGNNSIRSWHAGGYIGGEAGALRIRTGGSWGWYTSRAARVANVNAFSDSLQSRYKGRAWQLFGEVGLGLEAGDLSIEPYANLTRVDYRSKDFAEIGGAAALRGQSEQKATWSTLGLRAATRLDGGGDGRGSFARVNVGWRHDLENDGANAHLAFASSSPTYIVAGAVPGKDALVTDIALDLAVNPALDLGVTYGGQATSEYMAHSIKATLQFRF